MPWNPGGAAEDDTALPLKPVPSGLRVAVADMPASEPPSGSLSFFLER